MTTLTRPPASSGYPERGEALDAPEPAGPRHPDAEAADQWGALAPVIAARARMRLSYDQGRNYPRRLDRPLSLTPPSCPAAVHVYSHEGTTRLLVADFDVKRAAGRGASDPAGQVTADATAFAALIRHCGGRGFGDISPNGGRHGYVLWAAALPFAETRRIALALAMRYPSLDPSPMLGREHGLIRPPGSRHRSGGYQLLTTPLAEARRTAAAPNGAQVWDRLCHALRDELTQVDAGAAPVPPAALETAAGTTAWHTDRHGKPWLPRAGGPIPRLRADLETAAVTGVFDTTRYGTDRSAARFAILCSAAARGWQLEHVTTRLEAGGWPGLAGFYARYSPASRVKELAADWEKAVAYAAGVDSDHAGNTRENTHTGGSTSLVTNRQREDELQMIRRWYNAVRAGERHRWTGPHGITVRLVVRALAAAAQMTGSVTVEFGTRSLGMLAGLDHSTVARVLRELREEDDPYIDLVEGKRGLRGDLYMLVIPGQVAEAASWTRWRPGRLGIHPVFRLLGGPAALVFEQLTGTAATRLTDLPVLTGLSRSAVSAALAALGSEGLAVRQQGGWCRGPADLDDVADRLGVPEILAAIAGRHREQRQQWRAFLVATATFPASFWEDPWPDDFISGPDPVLAAAAARSPPRP